MRAKYSTHNAYRRSKTCRVMPHHNSYYETLIKYEHVSSSICIEIMFEFEFDCTSNVNSKTLFCPKHKVIMGFDARDQSAAQFLAYMLYNPTKTVLLVRA